MLRSSLVASAVALLCAAASAQQVNLSRVQPITSPIKHAGVFNLQTGKFQGTQKAVPVDLYRNDCTWAGGAFYVGTASCEDDYDEGRVPVVCGQTSYPVTGAEFAYCTSEPTGTVDIDWVLFDTQPGLGGGSCTFGQTSLPGTGLVGFISSTAGFPLPGATVVGGVSCWIVGFTTGTASVSMNAGATSADQFVWAFAQNNNNATPSGPILSGEPLIPGGAGTFGTPPGTDPLFGTPCGHGLDNQDFFWANVDNTIVGGVPPAGCLNAPGAGTNCYWFGGYPTNPFAGAWFRIEGDATPCCSNNVSLYCTAKTASNGCVPAIAFVGPDPVQFAAAGTTTANFTVSNVSPRPGATSHLGQLFYGTTGAIGAPFLGGTLCVKGLLRVPPLVNTGGTVGSTTLCDASITQNFNARIASGSDSKLTAGATVWMQGWARDIAAFQGVQLSNAATFTICP